MAAFAASLPFFRMDDPVHSGLGQIQLLGDLAQTASGSMELQHVASVALEAGSTTRTTLFTSPSKPRQRSLRQAHPLLLGYNGKDADDGVFEHAAGIQVLFRKAAVPHAIGC